MWATGWPRPDRLEVGWALFASANLVAMVLWPGWETIPFHFIWISLTLVFGFRVWRRSLTSVVLGVVIVGTGAAILVDAFDGIQLWGELFEVPLMAAMFLAMVWHARRRAAAIASSLRLAEQSRELLEREEQLLHDVSHELRTPVTIARGHLELRRRERGAEPEIDVALDELGRMEHVVERLLLIAQAERPDFIRPSDIELEPFLEDVFMRWTEMARRAWQLGSLPGGTLHADPDRVRTALDALLENAVKHTEELAPIELRGRAAGDEVVLEVVDGGPGIAPEVAPRVFERFARADAARSRADGGAGLGLAIVDAIARGHGGRASVRTSADGSTFSLVFPGYRHSAVPVPAS
jgi:two-component system OmpR family sensor kinase